MATGDTIDLFLDKDDLEWGDTWRQKLDESLSSVAFFIPVMTPRYFLSSQCRGEFQFFARRASSFGIKELVLPLHYVDVPELGHDQALDDLVELVRTFQWVDWRELRYAEVESAEYRKAVAGLVDRLVRANRQAEEVDVAGTALRIEEDAFDTLEDDEPGLIDQLAGAETTLPKWRETLEKMTQEMEKIGRVLQEATADINKADRQGRGSFAQRLGVAKKLGRHLADPVERISTFGNEFVSQLHDVDQGIRAFIERASTEIEIEPDAKEGVCEFFSAVCELSAAATEGLGSVQEMINTIEPIERMSRDLRPVLRRLRKGLTVMVEGRDVSDSWVDLIESSGIDCSDFAANEEAPVQDGA